jgi:RNA polymerase sigma factor (sigma-70 family)
MPQPDRRGAVKAADPTLLSRAVARAKEHDVDALRFLYVRFADDVCRYVQSIVGDRRAAETLTQTVLSELPAEMRRFEPGQMPFKAWLLRVAHNAAVDHLRSRHVVPFEEVRGRDARFDGSGDRPQRAGTPSRRAPGLPESASAT